LKAAAASPDSYLEVLLPPDYSLLITSVGLRLPGRSVQAGAQPVIGLMFQITDYQLLITIY
jgi:hypothetical protein